MENTRVVVTGMGALSSVGNGVDALWTALLGGVSGLGPVTRFDASKFRTRIAGEIKNFDPLTYLDVKEARHLDAFCHYAVACAQEALAQAGLLDSKPDPERIGVFVSTGIGGIGVLEDQIPRLQAGGPSRVSPFLVPMMIADMAAGYIAMRYNFHGPNFAIVSACATGSHSLGEAWWAIKRGDADIMLAGGTEACITPISMAGFCSMKAMSARNDEPQRASRPFDRDRDGFVIAEGAGVLVLERLEHARARGATILGEMVGYGASADAHHFTSPAPDGRGAAQAIRNCLNRGRLQPRDIGYINAHGTSTPLNDKFETMAIKKVLGDDARRVPISSTKSLTGHALGAAGGLEAIVCLKTIASGRIPGTYNYENPDPDCDLDYVPNQTRDQAVDVALSLNFGFGGHNAAVAFARYNG